MIARIIATLFFSILCVLPWPGPAQGATPSEDCLFNWAETHFPTLFSPAGSQSITATPLYGRIYSQTDAILATDSSSGDLLYYGSASGYAIFNLGPVSGWYSASGCEGAQTPSFSTLPDTGQTLCYDESGNVISCAGTGQDGAYSINPKFYTDNGNGTVTDNVTGLIWQKEDDNVFRTWADSGTYCSDLTLGGSSNWRLPSKKELVSIVDYASVGPAIDPTFTGTESSIYWSSTSSANDPGDAWGVGFYDGYVSNGNKTNNTSVRCVR